MKVSVAERVLYGTNANVAVLIPTEMESILKTPEDKEPEKEAHSRTLSGKSVDVGDALVVISPSLLNSLKPTMGDMTKADGGRIVTQPPIDPRTCT